MDCGHWRKQIGFLYILNKNDVKNQKLIKTTCQFEINVL